MRCGSDSITAVRLRRVRSRSSQSISRPKAAGVEEVELHQDFEAGAVAAFGPGPIEVAEWLEASDTSGAQAAAASLQCASRPCRLSALARLCRASRLLITLLLELVIAFEPVRLHMGIARLDMLGQDDATKAILAGPNDVGKSTLARNIAHQALIHGHTVPFISAGQLLGDLAALGAV
jgi:hypothetical protein